MAITTYLNPRFYKGPILELVTMRAKDGITFQPGMFARNTATGVVLTTAATGKAQFLTASTQVVATSSSDIKLYKIPSNETKLLIDASSGANSTVANKNMIGQNVGIAVNSCIVTASITNTTNAFLHIEEVLHNVAVGRGEGDTSANPGTFIVSVIQAKLDGDAA